MTPLKEMYLLIDGVKGRRDRGYSRILFVSIALGHHGRGLVDERSEKKRGGPHRSLEGEGLAHYCYLEGSGEKYRIIRKIAKIY